MSALTIVATITAVPEQAELVFAELKKLVPPTLAEAGCLQYDLHRDNVDPARFLFYENWESRELWLAHMESAHLAAFKEATGDAVVDLVIYEMTRSHEA
jgi:quinol monooxygenase YgiN